MNKRKKLIYLVVALIICFLMLTTGCGTNSSNGSISESSNSGEYPYPNIEWRMASAWAAGSNLFSFDERYAEVVSELTEGHFVITPYGTGQLCNTNQILDMVSGGTLELGTDCPTYWSGYNTAFDLLCTTMFDFTGWDYYIWIDQGGGRAYFDQLYGEHNCKYFLNNITQMESGMRSSKPIEKLSDLKGLNVRFAGKIQGLVAERLNMNPVSLSADEIYEALQRGVVDAAEFSNITNDYLLGISEVAPYWLTPGWHQTSCTYGVLVNEDEYNKLPEYYQQILEWASQICIKEGLARSTWSDSIYTNEFLKDGVKTTTLSDDDMSTIRSYWLEAGEQMAAENPQYAEVWNSMMEYRRTMDNYRTAMGDWGFGYNLDKYPNIKGY